MFGSVVIFGSSGGKVNIGIVPFQSGSLTYTGAVQSPTWVGFDSSALEIGGTTSATNAGTYTVIFTPKNCYVWGDGSRDTKSVSWTIGRAVISVPSQKGSLSYTGSEQSPTWDNYDTNKMTIGGTTKGTNDGTYTATFTPKANYQWPDGTTGTKSVTWTIGKTGLTAPFQSGGLTYTGSELTPSWSGYDTNKMTIGGTTKATNAGTYTATFTVKTGYSWSDGTTGAKSVSWSIGKAAGSLSLNKSSMTLDVSTLTETIAVTRAGDGAITASSSDTRVATVSVSGNTVTVTAKAKGSATITVNVAAGTNHAAPTSKTCSVTVDMPSTKLDECTPEEIQKAARAGAAPSLWSVGDKIGIALNGTVGVITLNATYYAVIIGFNHNSALEGNNSIHFQFGQTSDGTSIAFCDEYIVTEEDHYIQKDQTKWNKGFAMHHEKRPYEASDGAWETSDMRNITCPEFLAAMPTEWQNVIVPCTKYDDDTGHGYQGNDASCITSTSGKIWLISGIEVHGLEFYTYEESWLNSELINKAQGDFQEQYDYYKNGNSKVRYRHNDTTIVCAWRCRTQHNTLGGPTFVTVGEDADSSDLALNVSEYVSLGFAPCFMVA